MHGRRLRCRSDGLDSSSFCLPKHILAVARGRPGCDYFQDRLHAGAALAEELRAAEDRVGGCDDQRSMDSKKQWGKAFVDCFCRADAELEAPDTAGTRW